MLNDGLRSEGERQKEEEQEYEPGYWRRICVAVAALGQPDGWMEHVDAVVSDDIVKPTTENREGRATEVSARDLLTNDANQKV
jgi:hypothetical protein